jgi:hypothetical protein
MSANRSPDDAAIIRRLIDEMFQSMEAGDQRRVEQIQRDLRDVIGRRVPAHSTIRGIRPLGG